MIKLSNHKMVLTDYNKILNNQLLVLQEIQREMITMKTHAHTGIHRQSQLTDSLMLCVSNTV